MIQNAEDAGATKVTFLIDHTTYGKNAELLYDPHLADHQVIRHIIIWQRFSVAKQYMSSGLVPCQ